MTLFTGSCVSILWLILSCFFGAICADNDPNTTTSVPPAPLVPIFKVLNGTDICLLVQANLKFTINYYTTKGETVPAYFYINETSSTNLRSSGTCDKTMETLQLMWFPEPMRSAWSLELRFTQSSSDRFSLTFMSFNFTVTETLFPDTNETSAYFLMYNASQFTCPFGSYFQCLSQQTSQLVPLPQTPVATDLKVYLTMSNFKVEAFRSGPDASFLGTLTECSADYVPNQVVPIVVGVALASMIVIALITFIVASRRRQRGYQTI